MDKFDKIWREKFSKSEHEYSDQVWENVNKAIPPKETSNPVWLLLICIVTLAGFSTVFSLNNIQKSSSQDKTAFLFDTKESNKQLNNFNATKKPLRILDESTFNNNDKIEIKSESKRKDFNVQSQNFNAGFYKNNSFQEATAAEVLSNSKNDGHEGLINIDHESFLDNSSDNERSNLGQDITISNNRSQSNIFLQRLNKKKLYFPYLKRHKKLKALYSKTKKICPVFKEEYNPWYLALNHYMGYSFSNYSNVGAESLDYSQLRMQSEDPQFSFSDEILLGYKFKWGAFAESGIRYDQIIEKFNHVDDDAIRNTTVIVIDTLFTGDTTIAVADTTSIAVPGVYSVTSRNISRRISIPINVGYEIPLNDHVSVAGGIGVILNLWSDYSGKIFNENLDIVDVSDFQKTGLYKARVHSLQLSLKGKFKVAEQLSLTAGIAGIINPNSISSNNYPFDQRIKSYNISLGGQYKF